MRVLFKLLTFSAAGLLLGLGSAWYMITHGSALTLQKVGPWTSWVKAGNPEADPYTRAHFSRSGRLPITSTSARYYVAHLDSSGSRLDAECEYVISGSAIPSSWWSLAVYDESGGIIPNKAQRYTYNKNNLSLQENDSYEIRLSPYARSGNWIPLAGSGDIQLVLRIYRLETTEDLIKEQEAEDILPVIRRIGC